MDVREGTTTWLKAKVPVNERVPYFQALDGDAILGRGSQTSSTGRRQHLASGLPSGLGAGLVGTMGAIEGYILGPSPLPRQHLEPGPPSARPHPAYLVPGAGCGERPPDSTADCPWPPAARSPPPAAGALPGTHWGCFQAPMGSSPGFCPGHQSPAPGQQEGEGPSPPAWCRGRWRREKGGAHPPLC